MDKQRVHKNTWIIVLALAGTIPFLFADCLVLLKISYLPQIGNTLTWLKSYILIIECFMAGIYWGLGIATTKQAPLNLFLCSNALVLSQWFAYIILESNYFLTQSILFFLLILILDSTLYRARMFDKVYLILRILVTTIVITSIIINLSHFIVD